MNEVEEVGNKQPYHKNYTWKIADLFVKECYLLLHKFPDDERFNMTSQLRRASLSVPLNIVEGNARKSRKELQRFLYIARGSVTECAYLLELARDFRYITIEEHQEIEKRRSNVSFLLQKTLDSLR